MRGERLKEILDELRGLVEQAQDALDERPIRLRSRRLLTALRAKIDEAEAEDAEDEGEQQP